MVVVKDMWSASTVFLLPALSRCDAGLFCRSFNCRTKYHRTMYGKRKQGKNFRRRWLWVYPVRPISLLTRPDPPNNAVKNDQIQADPVNNIVCYVMFSVCSILTRLTSVYVTLKLTSVSHCVHFVARHAVWYGRMASPLDCSEFQCCSGYHFEYENFISLSSQYIQSYYWLAV